ncbi:DUF1799 domain-containing protein [Pseudoduganella sp. RAF19]
MAAAQADASGFEVWPENWPVFHLFCQLQTQWRAGSSGLLGLDYNVLYHKLDRMDLPLTEYEQWEADVCAMEFAALEAMQEQRE